MLFLKEYDILRQFTKLYDSFLRKVYANVHGCVIMYKSVQQYMIVFDSVR